MRDKICKKYIVASLKDHTRNECFKNTLMVLNDYLNYSIKLQHRLV